MGVTEIVLLIVGGIIFILSFLIPARGEGAQLSAEAEKAQARELLEQELATVRGQAEEMAGEAVSEALEKVQRTLERLSNEKIMAVSEYSDTVLAQIHKDHEEAMFLYDMLNNKQVALKNAMAELNRTMKDAQGAIDDLQKWTARGEGEALEGIADILTDAGREVPQEQAQGIQPVPGNQTTSLWEETGEGETADISGEENDRGNSNGEILALYRQGMSEVAIARKLGLGVGVVQLVCNLYRERTP